MGEAVFISIPTERWVSCNIKLSSPYMRRFKTRSSSPTPEQSLFEMISKYLTVIMKNPSKIWNVVWSLNIPTKTEALAAIDRDGIYLGRVKDHSGLELTQEIVLNVMWANILDCTPATMQEDVLYSLDRYKESVDYIYKNIGKVQVDTLVRKNHIERWDKAIHL